MGNIAPLYLSRDAFLQRAAAEMDQEYVASLDRYGTVWMFILVVALSLAAAAVSERISEKILKMKNKREGSKTRKRNKAPAGKVSRSFLRMLLKRQRDSKIMY